MYSNIVHYSLYKLQHQKTLLNIIKFNVFDTIACFVHTCKIYNLKRNTTTGLHHNLHIVVLLITFSILISAMKLQYIRLGRNSLQKYLITNTNTLKKKTNTNINTVYNIVFEI